MIGNLMYLALSIGSVCKWRGSRFGKGIAFACVGLVFHAWLPSHCSVVESL
uniref:Uncharacterized protein n=1 Tax=Anguilla anguilla TaxID=7936 RepID=A0A0E9SBF5_ANGAN